MSSNGDGFGAWNPDQISRYTAENELETDGELIGRRPGQRTGIEAVAENAPSKSPTISTAGSDGGVTGFQRAGAATELSKQKGRFPEGKRAESWLWG